VPSAATIGFLENPNNPVIFESMRKDVTAAASVIGLKVEILKAGTDPELDLAFESLMQARTRALLVGNDTFFSTRIEHVAELAARHAIPTMYSLREFAVAGGLISYGVSLVEVYRQVGVYVGKILNGMKPTDLPVVQPTKIELIINLKSRSSSGHPKTRSLRHTGTRRSFPVCASTCRGRDCELPLGRFGVLPSYGRISVS
jgi:putative tryptophan/tyrosine transport system substrate-binding protein